VNMQSCFPMLTRQRSILLRHPVLIRTAVSVKFLSNKKRRKHQPWPRASYATRKPPNAKNAMPNFNQS
jgi:hypothetical protein